MSPHAVPEALNQSATPNVLDITSGIDVEDPGRELAGIGRMRWR